jgi:UDP-glucuronate 4-epimerase
VSTNTKKTFLITGAAGFIGSHLFKALSDSGNYKVIGVDSFTDYYSVELKKARVSNFLEAKGHFEFADLSDRSACRDLLERHKPTHVIHLAAQAGIRLPLEENGKYVKENLVSFVNIASESVSLKVENFLYASSSSVYGSQSHVPFSELEQLLSPVSFYGLTKLFNEQIIENLARSSSTRFRGMRFFTVYGPWGRPDMAYFKLIVKGLTHSEFKLNGSGNVKRDFTYVSDVVDSIVKLSVELEQHETGFQDLVNIGGGKPVSMADLISEIEKALGSPIKILKGEANVNDLPITNASILYQNQLIGNAPGTSLETGIRETVKWAIRDDITKSLTDWSLGHK